jgi:hypothetical protein
MQRNIAARLGEQGNDAFALAQPPKLLRAANLRDVGAGRHQRQHYLRLVDCAFDFGGPGSATGDALCVEPGIEALRRQIALETLRQVRSVLPGIRDENAFALLRHGWELLYHTWSSLGRITLVS